MELILGQLLDFLPFVFMDNPGVVPQPGDKLDTQFAQETQILFGGVPVVKRKI
jgi:hypothetical protein